MRLEVIAIKKYFVCSLVCICTMLLFNCQISRAGENELVYAITHWPPQMVVEDSLCSGIDVEILKIIAERLNIRFDFRPCPWKRCLLDIENGIADITSSLSKTPEREEYMIFIEPPYITNTTIAFYVKKGEGIRIQKYEDLRSLRIGVTLGDVYFPRFDEDSNLEKEAVDTAIQNFKKLKLGRIDTFVNMAMQADYRIATEGYSGLFEKASFRYSINKDGYFAISKKSTHAANIAKFNDIMRQMVSEGEIQIIENRYFESLKNQHTLDKK